MKDVAKQKLNQGNKYLLWIGFILSAWAALMGLAGFLMGWMVFSS